MNYQIYECTVIGCNFTTSLLKFVNHHETNYKHKMRLRK